MNPPGHPPRATALAIVLLWLPALPVRQMAAQVREFTPTHGKKFLAEVVSATASEAMLAGMPFNQPKRTAIATLSEADRAYLEEWRKARALLGKVPLQIKCWRERTATARITDGKVKHLAGFTRAGKFYSGRSSVESENLYNDRGYPGVVTRETHQVRASITLLGEAPPGPVEIEGEIWHGHTLFSMVEKKDLKATLPAPDRNREATADLVSIELDKILLNSGSNFRGGSRNRNDQVEHINLRFKINGMVIGQFVGNDVPLRQ